MKRPRNKFPQAPGIYIFRDAEGCILYVGKAMNLHRRLQQYFRSDDSRVQIGHLMAQAQSVETIKTSSEFDALLLEASLIRQYKPKYNAIAKDDKSPLYIVITLSQEYPRVRFVRGNQLSLLKSHDQIFGPFQTSRIARSLMRNLRHSIPFCTQKILRGKPCFYTHLGLCSPCPSFIVSLPDGTEKNTKKHEYRVNLFRLRDVLTGKSRNVLKLLQKEMRETASRNDFENARIKKGQIDALYSIYMRHWDISTYITRQDALKHIGENDIEMLQKELLPYFPDLPPLVRIECVDISNLSGTSAVGSLVVLQNGIPDSSQYRRFRIRNLKTPNDVGMMDEVLTRRFAHREWPFPDLLVVDGGKSQLGMAQRSLMRHSLNIPSIGLAKRLEEVVIAHEGSFRIVTIPLRSPALQLLQRIRDEAHRFAIQYHRKLREKRTFVTMRNA